MKQSTATLLSFCLPQVREAIRSVPLLEYEYDIVANLVTLAADLFLANDLKYSKALFEQEWDRDGLVGIFDLVLLDPNLPVKVVDWKTTSNVDRPNHGTEVKNDLQTDLYLGPGSEWLYDKYKTRPQFLEYRCLDYRLQEKFKTDFGENDTLLGHSKVYSVERKAGHYSQAMTQKGLVNHIYYSLEGLQTWPQRRKECFAYGQECPFLNDCQNLTMPLGVTEEQFNEARPHSKSSLSSFLACPERYRRTRVLGSTDTGDDSKQLLGESFHAAACILWSEGFKRR